MEEQGILSRMDQKNRESRTGPSQPEAPPEEQTEKGPVERPIIKASSPEDIQSQAVTIGQNIQEHLYGDAGEDNYNRIEAELAQTSGEQQLEAIGELAEDLLREIYRNAILSGHKPDKMAMLDGLASAVSELMEVAEGAGARAPGNEQQDSNDAMIALMVAGKALFVDNPPEGLESTEEEIQGFIDSVSNGDYDDLQNGQLSSAGVPKQGAENGGNPQ